MTDKDLQAREKQELRDRPESTRDVPMYVPAVDIYESENAITVVADMPGVSPENLTIDVRDNQLTLQGTVIREPEKRTALMREYGVGDYYRQFTLGRMIDQGKIEAHLKDGVLTLTLPKADASKPRKITVKTG